MKDTKILFERNILLNNNAIWITIKNKINFLELTDILSVPLKD